MGNSCTSACCGDPEDAVLKTCTTDNTARFLPEVARAKVVSVYDGDTITIAARHGRQGKPYLFKVRLAGIDAAEMRGSSDEEKLAAVAARDALRELILGKMVKVVPTGEQEKYGRLLARVVYKKRDVCDWMVEMKYALPYDGGTKSMDASALRTDVTGGSAQARERSRGTPQKTPQAMRTPTRSSPAGPSKTPPTAKPAKKTPPAPAALPSCRELWLKDGPRKVIGH